MHCRLLHFCLSALVACSLLISTSHAYGPARLGKDGDMILTRSKRSVRMGLAAGCLYEKVNGPAVSRRSFPRYSKVGHKRFVKAKRQSGEVATEQGLNGTSVFKHSCNTLKLGKVRQKRDQGVHPLMYFQQHVNRALGRLARMQGRALDPETLADNLRKRWVSLDQPLEDLKIKKRHIRVLDGVRVDLVRGGIRSGARGEGRGGRGRGGRGGDATGSTAASTATESSAAESGTDSTTEARTASSTDSAAEAGETTTTWTVGDQVDDDADGFSQAELDALLQNLETEGPDNMRNVLGLDIQANDVGYFTDIQLGTPPRDFNILIDSGSADLWVPSQACQTCGDHQILGSSVSSSFVPSNTPFQVTYGSGEVEGAVVQDDVAIGNLKITGHTFGVTTDESVEFGGDSVLFDGLMGTAQSILANQGVLTPIEALAQNGGVPAATMGYALGRVADGLNDGTVTFGGVNTAQIDGDLVEVPNVSQVGFWEAAIDDITVNGVSLNLPGRSAILDTGTTLAILPPADAKLIHASIPGASSDGQGGFIIPCDTSASVAFTFGGREFAIDARDLAFLPLSNDLQGDCQSGITSGNIGGDTQYLIGDIFLKSVYFATDVGSNTIGLGVQA